MAAVDRNSGYPPSWAKENVAKVKASEKAREERLANRPCRAKSPPITHADTSGRFIVPEVRTEYARCMKPQGHEGNHAVVRGDQKVWEWPND